MAAASIVVSHGFFKIQHCIHLIIVFSIFSGKKAFEL